MFNIFKNNKKEPENLKELLAQFAKLKEDFKKISNKFETLKKESKFTIQKKGIVRFNPFSEVGGNQSFSIALLDGEDDGVVITSFYTREGNRIYGKPIEKGTSKYKLSKEEVEAINVAKKSKTK